MGNVLKKLALVVFSLLIVALLMELFLRVLFYHSKDFSMEMWKYAVAMKRAVPDPKLSFVHEPNTHAFLMGQDVKINSLGLRDFELLARQASRGVSHPGARRLDYLWLGSFHERHGVEDSGAGVECAARSRI